MIYKKCIIYKRIKFTRVKKNYINIINNFCEGCSKNNNKNCKYYIDCWKAWRYQFLMVRHISYANYVYQNPEKLHKNALQKL